jgi:hypothetical protein
MKKITIFLVVFLCMLASRMFAQNTFEERSKIIASKIGSIVKEEKEALKGEVERVNNQLTNGSISREEAEIKKKTLAEARAITIESRVAVEQLALKNLVQEQVDGKLVSRDTSKTIVIHLDNKFSRKKVCLGEKRTTTQFVFAAGLNNLISNGELEDANFRFIGSHFYEWGFTYNSRILKNENLLHAKYGLSLMYNNLRPTDNRSFVVNGEQTNLVTNTIYLKDSRFRNVYLVVPIHLEFDFSGKSQKGDKSYFKTHQNFRLGFGGYAGVNLKTKQITKYEDVDFKATQKSKGDFNANTFIYGLSTYIGYKSTSFYFKYDLNPLFKDNVVAQNNVSLGVRFDFN